MNTNQFGHTEFEDRIAAYVAGGLEGEERAAFEAHRVTCEPCAAMLSQALEADRSLVHLFDNARPQVGFEDRLIQGLRAAPSHRLRIHPAVWRAATGLAAVLVLGATGYLANELIQHNRLPLLARVDTVGFGNSLGDFDHNGDGLSGEAMPASQPPGFGEIHRINGKLNESEISERFHSLKLTKPAGIRANIELQRSKTPMAPGMTSATVPMAETAKESKAGAPKDSAPASSANPTAATGLSTATNGTVTLNWAAPAVGDSYGIKTTTDQLSDSTQLGLVSKVDKSLGANSQSSAGEARILAAEANFDPVHFQESQTRSGVAGRLITGGFGGYAPYGADRGFGPAGPTGGGVPAGGAGAGIAPTLGDQPLTGKFFKITDLNALAMRGEGEKDGDGIADRKKLGGIRDFGAVADGRSQTPGLGRGGASIAGKPALVAAGTELALADHEQNVTQTPPPQPPVQQSAVMSRKIIRNGEMEFEVDSFDSSFVQISRIVGEEGGFVSSTNSEKLPNGKVRGTVIVRVPPDRLDTFVLKLRALGDLKSQKIAAQDVTKAYYDLESELKAGRAMEERLLNMIKTGKGEIKDLLEAEKQLGVYRERIEKLEGEIRYYNNLVSLSTLSVTAYERDIRNAAFASQTEQVSMGIETEDVEKARSDALKAIDEAKGRVIESNLKKYDAGQLAATVVAEITPDASGPLIDRLRQLGRLARLDIDRKQTTPEGATAPAGARVERKDTRFAISIYNLANIAPRQTTNANLAVPIVEDAYKAILDMVKDRKGRVVTSSLNRQKPEQTTATISFEVPSAEADAALAELRRGREVMTLTVTENPDTNNITAAKRGFSVQIFSLATVAPREVEQLVLTAKRQVADAFRALLAEVKKADARILVSQLNEQDPSNINGVLDVEVIRGKELDVRQALLTNGEVISRNVNRSADAENTVDSKIRLQIRLISLDRLSARETQTIEFAARDVAAAYQSMLAVLQDSGGRVMQSQLNEQDRRNITGVLEFEVPTGKRAVIERTMNEAGIVYSRSVARAANAQNTVDVKVRMLVNLKGVDQLPPREQIKMAAEVSDVEKATNDVLAASAAAGGRTIEPTSFSRDRGGNKASHVVIDVPASKADQIRDTMKSMGVVSSESSTNPQTPEGEFARAQFDITLANASLLKENEGLAAALRSALLTSARGLLWSLQFIVIGLLFVGPWAVLVWLGWKLFRRSAAKPAAATPTTA